MLDQRQYRDDQPCDDAVVARRAPSWTQPRDLLGRKQMGWAKRQLVLVQGRLEGGRQRGDDDAGQGARRLVLHVRLLAGLPDRARGAARATSQDKGIDDVVFVTGDIHTFIAGDVRTEDGAGETVALEFVGGSITSQSLGETNLDAGGGGDLPGNDANPNTAAGAHRRAARHQPLGRPGRLRPPRLRPREVSRKAFDVTLKRVSTIKEQDDGDRDDRRLPLPRRARAEVDQGRQRAAA